jgi:hypothetical protein
MKISPKQREILEDMQAGDSLEQDGWGFFQIVRSGERRRRVSDVSCRGLVQRGMIRESKREEHPGYVGGSWTWYELTERGGRCSSEGPHPHPRRPR